jgi:hypothetical protein
MRFPGMAGVFDSPALAIMDRTPDKAIKLRSCPALRLIGEVYPKLEILAKTILGLSFQHASGPSLNFSSTPCYRDFVLDTWPEWIDYDVGDNNELLNNS